MELDELQVLRLIQERLTNKVYSFRNVQDFIAWVKAMTCPKFKELIIKCVDDAISEGDIKKTDLLELRSLFDG